MNRTSSPATSSLRAGLYKLQADTPRIGPLGRLGAPALLFANTGKRFDAVVANNDEMALGAINALKAVTTIVTFESIT